MLLQAVGNNGDEKRRAPVSQLLRMSSCSLSSQPAPPPTAGWDSLAGLESVAAPRLLLIKPRRAPLSDLRSGIPHRPDGAIFSRPLALRT